MKEWYQSPDSRSGDAFADTRVETARIYLDSADYFNAFFQVARQARERLLIVGWPFSEEWISRPSAGTPLSIARGTPGVATR